MHFCSALKWWFRNETWPLVGGRMASDVATCVLNQLTRHDGERETPVLVLYICNLSTPPFGGECARINFSVFRGVPSFVVTIGDLKMRTACPTIAAITFTGAQWVTVPTCRSVPPTALAVVLETTYRKTHQGDKFLNHNVMLSEGLTGTNKFEVVKRLAHQLAPLLSKLSEMDVFTT